MKRLVQGLFLMATVAVLLAAGAGDAHPRLYVAPGGTLPTATCVDDDTEIAGTPLTANINTCFTAGHVVADDFGRVVFCVDDLTSSAACAGGPPTLVCQDQAADAVNCGPGDKTALLCVGVGEVQVADGWDFDHFDTWFFVSSPGGGLGLTTCQVPGGSFATAGTVRHFPHVAAGSASCTSNPIGGCARLMTTPVRSPCGTGLYGVVESFVGCLETRMVPFAKVADLLTPTAVTGAVVSVGLTATVSLCRLTVEVQGFPPSQQVIPVASFVAQVDPCGIEVGNGLASVKLEFDQTLASLTLGETVPGVAPGPDRKAGELWTASLQVVREGVVLSSVPILTVVWD